MPSVLARGLDGGNRLVRKRSGLRCTQKDGATPEGPRSEERVPACGAPRSASFQKELLLCGPRQRRIANGAVRAQGRGIAQSHGLMVSERPSLSRSKNLVARPTQLESSNIKALRAS